MYVVYMKFQLSRVEKCLITLGTLMISDVVVSLLCSCSIIFDNLGSLWFHYKFLKACLANPDLHFDCSHFDEIQCHSCPAVIVRSFVAFLGSFK